MTTTYSATGTELTYFDNSDDEGVLQSAEAITLTLTLPDDVTSFSFTEDPDEDDIDNFITETSVIFDETFQNAASLGGTPLNELFQSGSYDELGFDFLEITWSGGTFIVIGIYFFAFESNGNFEEKEFLFFLGDVPQELQGVTTEDDLEAFAIGEVGTDPVDLDAAINYPAQPGSPVALTSIEWDSITDNSGIEVIGDDDPEELDGTGGNDTIEGNGGNDTLKGGNGDDSINGGLGKDAIEGGNGDDHLDGGDARDKIIGGKGNDKIVGGAGNDRIEGGNGRDTIEGGIGNDRIEGGNGNDRIKGGNKNDEINGGEGNDRLKGGVGSDTINGEDGNDVLTGNGGADDFVFTPNLDNDTIKDFDLGFDEIFLDQDIWGGGLTLQQVLNTFADDSSGTVIFDFGGGNTITVNGVTSVNDIAGDVDFLV